MNKKVAKFLSISLGPHIWLPTIFIASITKTGLSADQIKVLFPSILFLQVILPLTYLFTARRLGWSSAWDLKTRAERFPLLLITLVTLTVSSVLIYFFGNTLLFHLSLILIILSAVFLLVNHYWQISLHSGLNTSGSILLNFLFQWHIPWVYLTIPAIWWARLVLKKHTPLQLTAGMLISLIGILAGLRYFSHI